MVNAPSRILDVDGLEVACYESPGKAGPGILLIHGNSSSAKAFAKQLEGPLGAELRVVALDLPGHGNSARVSRDPESVYRLSGYAAVVAAAAEQLGLTRGVFVGWSLGGDIILHAMARLADATGFMIFGTGPLTQPFRPDAFIEDSAASLGMQSGLSAQERAAYGTAFFEPGAPSIPEFIFSDIRDTDPAARKLLGASLYRGDYRDEAVILESASRPVAIVHGVLEQFVNLSFLEGLTIPTLWRDRVQTVDGAGHAVQMEQPSRFNRILEQFARAAMSGAE